jgi:hypothetical protein
MRVGVTISQGEWHKWYSGLWACPRVMSLIEKMPIEGTGESLRRCFDLMRVVNITIAQNEELARTAETFVSITDKYVNKWRKRAGSRA